MATKEELEKQLAGAEEQILSLLARCETLDFIAVLFGRQEASDEDLVTFLKDVADGLNHPAISPVQQISIEQQAGTNDPRLVKLWIEAHKAE